MCGNKRAPARVRVEEAGFVGEAWDVLYQKSWIDATWISF
ncbi:hypothetical protein LEP1GSC061_1320 [Leptospira wolffii serovar Khorat str. Khorat-H2]|nr:hypothetical protein LEP1GSC061_1320 [Leptospira wolffii serovar Khorat str. Khorat-H2]